MDVEARISILESAKAAMNAPLHESSKRRTPNAEKRLAEFGVGCWTFGVRRFLLIIGSI
jgi:hypothetical protein